MLKEPWNAPANADQCFEELDPPVPKTGFPFGLLVNCVHLGVASTWVCDVRVSMPFQVGFEGGNRKERHSSFHVDTYTRLVMYLHTEQDRKITPTADTNNRRMKEQEGGSQKGIN